MLKSYGVVAHVILVSAQVLLVLTLTLDFETSDSGLTIMKIFKTYLTVNARLQARCLTVVRVLISSLLPSLCVRADFVLNPISIIAEK